MTDNNVNVQRQSISIGSNASIPSENSDNIDVQARKQSGSVIGQDNALQLKTGQVLFEQSIAQLNENDVPLNSAGASDPLYGSDRAEKITPEHLKSANLKKLPVYMAARALGAAIPNEKARRLHGFVAIGQPGLGNAGKAGKGAKVFSYGSTAIHSAVRLDKSMAKKIAGDLRISKNVRDAVTRLQAKAPGGTLKFDTFQDFHRALYCEVMRADRDRMDRNNMSEDGYKQHIRFTHGVVNDDAAKLHALLHAKFRQSSGSGDASSGGAGRYGMEQNRSDVSDEKYKPKITQKKIDPKFVTKFDDVDNDGKATVNSYEQNPTKIKQSDKLAEQDARFFESPNYDKYLTLNAADDVNATDVIEAQRQQWAAQNYLDEKARVTDQMLLAPELALPYNEDVDIEDFMDMIDDRIELAESYLNEKSYAPIVPKNVKSWKDMDHTKVHQRNPMPSPQDAAMPDVNKSGDGLSKAKTHDKRRYKGVLVVPKKENDLSKWASRLAKYTPMSKNRLPNDGNCNAAAGSLIRLAGHLNGQKVDVRGGAHQHGHSKDVLWNPTPNFTRPQQDKTEFVGDDDDGGRIAGSDIENDDASSVISSDDDYYSNSPNPAKQQEQNIDDRGQGVRGGFEKGFNFDAIGDQPDIGPIDDNDNAPEQIKQPSVEPQQPAPQGIKAGAPENLIQANALEATTRREIETMKNQAAALNNAYKNLQEADALMAKYAPKPKFRLFKEKFQIVRDTMKNAMAAARRGDHSAMSRGFDRLGAAAAGFKKNRLAKFNRDAGGRDTDIRVHSLENLKTRLDRKYKSQNSGIKKMLIADFVTESAHSLRSARNDLTGSLLKTLSKNPKDLTAIEAEKLRVGVEMLGSISYPDKQIEALKEQAVTTLNAYNG